MDVAAREPDPVLLPVDEATAVYVDHAEAWLGPHGIGIDLFVLGPVDPDEGLRVAHPVVRVRLAASMVTPMAQALVAVLDAFDDRRGAP